jgi:hypothetical protein
MTDDQTTHVEQGPDDRGKEERKRDRQMIELLNELRVALPGVQILFAFLLTVPFSVRFERLTPFQRDVYYVTLMATALSTACLIAPSAAHRLRFHQGDRSFLVSYANVAAIAGLLCLMTAMLSAMLLVTDFVFSRTTALLATGTIAVVLLTLWFVVPLSRYARD